MLLAAILLFSGKSSGAPLAMVVCATLLVFFGMRWMKNRRFMPSGLMSLLSAAALFLIVWSRPS